MPCPSGGRDRHRVASTADALLGTALLLLAIACGRPSAQPEAETAASTSAAAPPKAFSGSLLPGSGRHVYVSDETGGNIAILGPDDGLVGHIAVGKRPRGLRLTKDGTRLLVALSGSPIAGPGADESKLPPADRTADGIGLVDLTTGRLIQKIHSGQDPEAFDISVDGKTLYVSNEETSELSVVDLASGTRKAHVPLCDEPEGVTVRPDGRVVYVTCEADNVVVAIDTRSLSILARIGTEARPRAVAFTADGRTAFVTDENGNAVTVIDSIRHRVTGTIRIPQTSGAPLPPRPMGAILSPDGREVFVSLGRARSIAVLDVAGRKLVRTIENVGVRPWGVGISADGRKLFTANGPSGDVSIVDTATGKVEKRIAVGGSPWGVAVADR